MANEICMLSMILLSGYVSISALLHSITMFYSSAYSSPAQNFQLRIERALIFMKAYPPSYPVSKTLSLIMFLTDIFLSITN